ncbi:fungal-specific transcription factor domain-containing protein [Aspergillus karnatakaensis]|uniref:transcription factor domain-containing protein n=1 Tax=Aspergillus karnatakaensis TaxID=1810916 RepID=UPI003CCD052D
MSPPQAILPAAKRPRIGERTMLACIGCKQKKLKCDGQSPKYCLVEDPATGLHRPRDYLKSLEARVAYLESLLQQVRPDVALDHMASGFGDDGYTLALSPTNGSNEIAHAPNHDQEASTAPGIARARRASSVQPDDQQVDVLSSEVALLCLSATGRDPHYFGASSAVSFSRIVSATMGLPATNSVGSGSQHSVISGAEVGHMPSARTEGSLRLPSASVAGKLTKAYFDNIHPQYPILHRPTFESWEAEFRRGSKSGNLADVPNIPLFFVLMVYAIGSLVLGQHHRQAAEEYYAAALDHIPPILELNNLESIQGILCCAIYSIRSPVGVSLWKISGMAIRHCVELGYHRSTECYRRNAGTLTKEMLKRCFWVAYDIDRVAAFILGRPVGIPEDAIDVELPVDIDDEHITATGFSCSPRTSPNDTPTAMTGALHVIRLRRLWAKFSDSLYSKSSHPSANHTKTIVESLRAELEEWRASLPSQLDFAHSNPLSVFASSEWFRLAYDHSILLLYRPFITTNSSGTNKDPSVLPSLAEIYDEDMVERAFDECALCAREMCLLYRRLYQSSSIQFTWGSLHILFLGGLTYLYCLWRSRRVREKTRQTDVVSTCLACSTVLVIIAERWNLATSYRDLFETLSEKTISMVCGDENLSNPPRGPWGLDSNTEDPLLQDWINNGLNDMAIPQESEWLVQELLQGVSKFSNDPFFTTETYDTLSLTEGNPNLTQ